MIFDYIGQHAEYGKHDYTCHVCGTNCDISGKVIFEGNQGGVWEGEHFVFPVCSTCFYEELGRVMEHMDSVMLQKEIEKERQWEKYWEDYEPPC